VQQPPSFFETKACACLILDLKEITVLINLQSIKLKVASEGYSGAFSELNFYP
jgi:hypothetical protein